MRLTKDEKGYLFDLIQDRIEDCQDVLKEEEIDVEQLKMLNKISEKLSRDLFN